MHHPAMNEGTTGTDSLRSTDAEVGHQVPGRHGAAPLLFHPADEEMTVLRGVINVMGDLLEIEAPPPRMRSDPVRIDGGRVSSIAYRPEVWPWTMDVTIVFNTTMLSQAQLLNLVQLAGFAIGIGDWRPEKGGTFG